MKKFDCHKEYYSPYKRCESQCDKCVKQQAIDEKNWDEAINGIMEYEAEIERHNNRLLKVIEKMNNGKLMKDFADIVCDVEIAEKMRIVSIPRGTKQNERHRIVRQVWVDQRCTNMEGDSFAGQIYFKLKPKKYLEIPYEC